MLKMTISASVWVVQHPNAGQNIQHLGTDFISLYTFQAFVGLSNLTSLSLRGNILTSLDPLQFSGLQNLIELDLSGNRLFSITPEAFEGLNRLETLRLDMNRLASIPLEALIRLPGKRSFINDVTQILTFSDPRHTPLP